MISRVLSGSLNGLEAQPVIVEIDLSCGLPGLTIVGLPDAAVNESKERIRSALKNSGFEFPLKKVIINLAPADVRKEGSGFDLPIALGILLANETLSKTSFLDKACFAGEVSLEGSLRGIQGALSMALMAKKLGYEAIVVPEENVLEASLVEGIEVFGLPNLESLPLFLLHPHTFLKPIDRQSLIAEMNALQKPALFDFQDIKGQTAAKRALEIAAAGGHNVLLNGSPGSGKSMLAKAFPGILPPLAYPEMLEVSQIYSAAGKLKGNQNLLTQRPYRSPHHSVSNPGLIGGGHFPIQPGEITLAHRGVLFLDEMVEFNKSVLELMRQPLEDGVITISRSQQSVTYPAKFILLGAMNPCPCGYKGDKVKQCICSDLQVQRYVSRISGPLLDRIDMHLEIARLNHEELMQLDGKPQGDSSETIRQRVLAARTIQANRFSHQSEAAGIHTNNEMSPPQLKQFCQLDSSGHALLQNAAKKLNFSARSLDRILRLARTIADLAASGSILTTHLAEALQYRAMDRLYQNNSKPLKPVTLATEQGITQRQSA
jgi:magnesium chelatase family protein